MTREAAGTSFISCNRDITEMFRDVRRKPYLALQLGDLFDPLRLQSLGQTVVQAAAGVFLPRLPVLHLQDAEQTHALRSGAEPAENLVQRFCSRIQRRQEEQPESWDQNSYQEPLICRVWRLFLSNVHVSWRRGRPSRGVSLYLLINNKIHEERNTDFCVRRELKSEYSDLESISVYTHVKVAPT